MWLLTVADREWSRPFQTAPKGNSKAVSACTLAAPIAPRVPPTRVIENQGAHQNISVSALARSHVELWGAAACAGPVTGLRVPGH